MRRYLTIGISKTGAVEIMHGPEEAYNEHIDAFRALAGSEKKGTPAHAEVHVIDLSKGLLKRKRFAPVKFKGENPTGSSVTLRRVGPPTEHKPAPKRKGKSPKTHRAPHPAPLKRAPHTPTPTAAHTRADEGTFPES